MRGPSRSGYRVWLNGEDSYSLTVPSHIVRLIPEGMRFVPELTEDGILYRIFESEPTIPSWARQETEV